jgi:hypothetical protein
MIKHMTEGINPFIQFPNGKDILVGAAWAGMPVTSRDLLMFAAGAANQQAPLWFAHLMGSGASLETAIQFILGGVVPIDVRPAYQSAPWYPVRSSQISDNVSHQSS